MFDNQPLIDPARTAALNAIKDVLRETPADHWYDVIRRTDTDEHYDLILWMVGHKKCDLSVALYALLQSDLPTVLRHGGTIDDCGPVAHTILANWITGKYARHVIDCTPDVRFMSRLLLQALEHATPTDETDALKSLLTVEGGLPLDLPSHLAPEHCADLWAIYNTLGLAVGCPPPGRLGKFRDMTHRLVASVAQAMPRPLVTIPVHAR